MDANSLVADVAYNLSECIFVYPISPATPMGEYVDGLHSNGKTNILDTVPELRQLQSEAGAAGSLHGSLLTGSLSSTFTASQGLLLMIPLLYKFVGEELPAVLHVASRSIASHALSIHCSHDDIYACATTGVAILCSDSVTMSRCNALVTHVAALVGSYPIIHFFDGYTVSHHYYCADPPTDEEIKTVLSKTGFYKALESFRARRMYSARPSAHGGYMGPGAFYAATDVRKHHRREFPEKLFAVMRAVKEVLKDAAEPKAFEYVGTKEATHVVVAMGSSVLTLEETLEKHQERGKLGLVKVRLFRPFLHEEFRNSLPPETKVVCVLERADIETQAVLYSDVAFALSGSGIHIIRGSYGLSSTDFAPSHASSVFDNILRDKEKRLEKFVVGINDDISHESLPRGEGLKEDNSNLIIFGFGSDGSVGASKSLVRIVKGEGDFEYDSYKSGGLTMCNIRLGVKREHYYRPESVNMGVITTESYVSRYGKVLVERIEDHGLLLINTQKKSAEELALIIPVEVREEIIKKNLVLKTLDANGIAAKVHGGRGSNILIMASIIKQLKYFDEDEDAVKAIQGEIEILYGRLGDEIVSQNMRCAEAGLVEENVITIKYDESWRDMPEAKLLTFREEVIKREIEKFRKIHEQEGNRESFDPLEDHINAHFNEKYDQVGLEELKTSIFSRKNTSVGISPAGTNAIRPRMVANVVPVWNSDHCIQCGQCAFNCPHGVIRTFVVDESDADDECVPLTSPVLKKECEKPENKRFVIKINAVQCTGCSVCATICPGNKMLKAKDHNEEPLTLTMTPVSLKLIEKEYEGFQKMEETRGLEKDIEDPDNVQSISLKKPLFAYSGGCGGCGELTYLVTLSRMFDNALIFNATGCSSIYGFGYPCTPYQKGLDGFGLAWANSLFEDNAEFGYGGAVSYLHQRKQLYKKIVKIKEEYCKTKKSEDKMAKLLNTLVDVETWMDVRQTRKLYNEISKEDKGHEVVPETLLSQIPLSQCFLFGGDGWAYDIGFGGLDHVLAECCQSYPEDVPNIIIVVVDSQLYSNTGGQRSKATPFKATVKLVCNESGRENERYARKDLFFTAHQYGCYYAAVSFSNPNHMASCFREAGKTKGVSLIRCLSPCIDHGIVGGLANRNAVVDHAVKSGIYPLISYNPATGKAKLGSEVPETTFNDELKAWVRSQRRTSEMSDEDIKMIAREFDETNRKIKRVAGL